MKAIRFPINMLLVLLTVAAVQGYFKRPTSLFAKQVAAVKKVDPIFHTPLVHDRSDSAPLVDNEETPDDSSSDNNGDQVDETDESQTTMDDLFSDEQNGSENDGNEETEDEEGGDTPPEPIVLPLNGEDETTEAEQQDENSGDDEDTQQNEDTDVQDPAEEQETQTEEREDEAETQPEEPVEQEETSTQEPEPTKEEAETEEEQPQEEKVVETEEEQTGQVEQPKEEDEQAEQEDQPQEEAAEEEQPKKKEKEVKSGEQKPKEEEQKKQPNESDQTEQTEQAKDSQKEEQAKTDEQSKPLKKQQQKEKVKASEEQPKEEEKTQDEQPKETDKTEQKEKTEKPQEEEQIQEEAKVKTEEEQVTQQAEELDQEEMTKEELPQKDQTKEKKKATEAESTQEEKPKPKNSTRNLESEAETDEKDTPKPTEAGGYLDLTDVGMAKTENTSEESPEVEDDLEEVVGDSSSIVLPEEDEEEKTSQTDASALETIEKPLPKVLNELDGKTVVEDQQKYEDAVAEAIKCRFKVKNSIKGSTDIESCLDSLIDSVTREITTEEKEMIEEKNSDRTKEAKEILMKQCKENCFYETKSKDGNDFDACYSTCKTNAENNYLDRIAVLEQGTCSRTNEVTLSGHVKCLVQGYKPYCENQAKEESSEKETYYDCSELDSEKCKKSSKNVAALFVCSQIEEAFQNAIEEIEAEDEKIEEMSDFIKTVTGSEEERLADLSAEICSQNLTTEDNSGSTLQNCQAVKIASHLDQIREAKLECLETFDNEAKDRALEKCFLEKIYGDHCEDECSSLSKDAVMICEAMCAEIHKQWEIQLLKLDQCKADQAKVKEIVEKSE